jgi:hypothetical protein
VIGRCGPGPLRRMGRPQSLKMANWLEPSGRLPYLNRVIFEN